MMYILLEKEILLLLKKYLLLLILKHPTIQYFKYNNSNVTNTINNNTFCEKKLVFKNNAPFISCISKINGIKTDNVEDLDVVMSMYNLLDIVKILEKQQVVYGIITEMNQTVVQIIII